jgi:hypothetical protein
MHPNAIAPGNSQAQVFVATTIASRQHSTTTGGLAFAKIRGGGANLGVLLVGRFLFDVLKSVDGSEGA